MSSKLMSWVWCECGLIFVYIVSDCVTSCSSLIGSKLKVGQSFYFLYIVLFVLQLKFSIKMEKYIPFCITKLFVALHRKDWKEVEKQQNKITFESFKARRGVYLSKSSPKHMGIVGPLQKSPK